MKNIKHLKSVKRKLGIKKRKVSKTSFLRKKKGTKVSGEHRTSQVF